jgi:hypothetical protein
VRVVGVGGVGSDPVGSGGGALPGSVASAATSTGAAPVAAPAIGASTRGGGTQRFEVLRELGERRHGRGLPPGAVALDANDLVAALGPHHEIAAIHVADLELSLYLGLVVVNDRSSAFEQEERGGALDLQ